MHLVFRSVAEATETRKAENAEFTTVKAQNNAAVQLLGVAENRLNKSAFRRFCCSAGGNVIWIARACCGVVDLPKAGCCNSVFCYALVGAGRYPGAEIALVSF